MNERKILFFILCVILYCLYSVNMWFMRETVVETAEDTESKTEVQHNTSITENRTEVTIAVKSKVIPLYMKDACTIIQVFTEKPVKDKHKETPQIETDNNTITVIGITVFLIILAINAVLDALKAKEEERAKKKLNPNGERRQSLSEFANRKPLRRESSKFGLQLFQIAESVNSSEEEKKTRRQNRPYTRGDSTNSYLSERKTKTEGSAPASVSDTPVGDPRLVKRQSVAKLFGGRPSSIARRSSFPALPLNPDVQALMLGHRQASYDSDDEGDGRGRRVRIIRRY